MGDFTALDISGAGMRAQRTRMQVITENLANQHTTGPDGPYQRRQAVFEARSINEFGEILEEAVSGSEQAAENIYTVAVARVQGDNSDPVRVLDPSHPMSDKNGYVMMPNIQVIREMADLMEASRSYKANMAAAKSTQDMLNATLELLRR
jgi:flagellar basal-body rod protein FlgC